MLSDIVWRGAFHRHIMTMGGRTATAAMTTHLVSESRVTVKPAIITAEIQTVASTALSDMSGIPEQ